MSSSKSTDKKVEKRVREIKSEAKYKMVNFYEEEKELSTPDEPEYKKRMQYFLSNCDKNELSEFVFLY